MPGIGDLLEKHWGGQFPGKTGGRKEKSGGRRETHAFLDARVIADLCVQCSLR